MILKKQLSSLTTPSRLPFLVGDHLFGWHMYFFPLRLQCSGSRSNTQRLTIYFLFGSTCKILDHAGLFVSSASGAKIAAFT